MAKLSAINRGLRSSRRTLSIGLGLLCVCIGAVGAVLPGLPTTVFLLAAAYLFARSSPALHRKLVQHPRLGPYLERFAEDRSMPARAKAISVALMWAGITLSIVLSGGALVFVAVMGTLGLIGTGVVLLYVRTTPQQDSCL